ncbi:hypothetical protein [Aeromicrobium endophyticum]|uniref:SgcJ/EcaC family oxidoreductase n=1 Tax=Aeromicrobium endophyticum TaxID=2292704 RepID=A0A371P3E1_9ACTN|nr:hypothetical protein [Aeromicrobium endophyticum]REK70457.1 hypothetical protein DX116_15085 [Aeromicrobium endophyticum]
MDWLWVLIVAVRAVSPAPDDQWAVRLAELDHVRERAYAASDPSMLDEVYVDGSRAQRADVRLIEDYRRRDGRVVGAELRVLSCRLLRQGSGRARLEVVDQLGPARVEWGDGTSTPLPRDRPTRRHVTLERDDDGRWRIAAARQVEVGS